MEWVSGIETAIVTALLFLGFLLYSRSKRRRDLAWIAKRFPGQKPVVASFGVTYWGQESEPGPVHKNKGFLLLLPDRIFFKGAGGLEWQVPKKRMLGVDHDHAIKGENLNQSVMIVQFNTEQGGATRAAFRVPYPPQWMEAIEKTLLNGPLNGKA